MFSEVTEVRDAIHLLTPRAASAEVGRALIREMAWYDRYLSLGGTDRAANPSPGNKRGGLANVVEKALGSIAKSGTSAIVDVLAPGEKVRRKGLVFAATPASDFVCGTQQLASGMTDPGGGQRPKADLVGPLGPAQRPGGVQPGAGDLSHVCRYSTQTRTLAGSVFVSYVFTFYSIVFIPAEATLKITFGS
jgi:hypothetical protein